VHCWVLVHCGPKRLEGCLFSVLVILPRQHVAIAYKCLIDQIRHGSQVASIPKQIHTDFPRVGLAIYRTFTACGTFAPFSFLVSCMNTKNGWKVHKSSLGFRVLRFYQTSTPCGPFTHSPSLVSCMNTKNGWRVHKSNSLRFRVYWTFTLCGPFTHSHSWYHAWITWVGWRAHKSSLGFKVYRTFTPLWTLHPFLPFPFLVSCMNTKNGWRIHKSNSLRFRVYWTFTPLWTLHPVPFLVSCMNNMSWVKGPQE
jgi:hypothetical protein